MGADSAGPRQSKGWIKRLLIIPTQVIIIPVSVRDKVQRTPALYFSHNNGCRNTEFQPNNSE